MPRLTWHLGRWIRGTDWYPDYQTRLYDRRAHDGPANTCTKSVAVDGPRGRLNGDLQHFAYRDIADHLETIDRYTTLAARQMHEDGRRVSLPALLFHRPLAFLRNYLRRAASASARRASIVSAMNAYYVFLKFAKLWQLQAAPPSRPEQGPRPV